MVDERKRLLPSRLDDTEEEGPRCCFPRINNKYLAKIAVLTTVAVERLSFYSISGNLVLFLNGSRYNWTSYNAINATLFFLGISCIFYFVGGLLADWKFGRFRMIFASMIIYIIGYVAFPVISNPDIAKKLKGEKGVRDLDCDADDQACSVIVFIALAVIGIGTGMMRANIAPFGSDQLRGEDPHSTVVFFNWYYWSINLGTLVALGGVAYLQQKTVSGFYHGYLISICCLAFGLVIFLSGKCTYTYRKPVGSTFVNMYKIVREAWRIKKRKSAQRFDHRLETTRGPADQVETPRPLSFLDHAKFRYGGSYHDHSVDDIKQLGRIILVFMSLIPYWMVYYQMESTFLVQGLHMNIYTGSHVNITEGCSIYPIEPTTQEHKFGVAVAWLSLFDVVLLILLIPIMDRIIYPWMNKMGWNMSMVKRIFIGFVCAFLSMITAGILEKIRLERYWSSEGGGHCCYRQVEQPIQNTTYYAADLSILWQVPQYSLIGLSEIFTSIAGLELASLVAPRSMKSSVMGLFYFFSGIGCFVGFAMMFSFQGTWFFEDADHGNINCRAGCMGSTGTCHLDYYFYVLGGVQVVGAVIFLVVVKKINLQSHLPVPQTNACRNTRQIGSRVSERSHRESGTTNIGNPSISEHRTDIEREADTDSPATDGEPGPSKKLNNVAKNGTFKRTIQQDGSRKIVGIVPSTSAEST